MGVREFRQVSPFLAASGRGQFNPKVCSLNHKEMGPWTSPKASPLQRGQAVALGDELTLQHRPSPAALQVGPALPQAAPSPLRPRGLRLWKEEAWLSLRAHPLQAVPCRQALRPSV